MADCRELDVVLGRVTELIGRLGLLPGAVLDVAALSYACGVPESDVRMLLRGKAVADEGVAARVRQRLALLVRTRRRGSDHVVRPLRGAAPHTQAEIALGIGVTTQALRSYQRPDNPGLPSVPTLMSISTWFQVHSGWLTEPGEGALARVLRDTLRELEQRAAEREMEQLLRDQGVRADALRAVGSLSAHKLEALMTLLAPELGQPASPELGQSASPDLGQLASGMAESRRSDPGVAPLGCSLPVGAAHGFPVRHQLVDVVGGHRIHVASQGTGPLVVLVHGFPESWYAWRHQMAALAGAGYRAAAIDVRGYGRSSKPGAVRDYRMLALVGDLVGVIQALGGEPAVVVGHGWGAAIAAHTALLRPSLVRAVGLLGMPYVPRNAHAPLGAFTWLGPSDTEFCLSYFQRAGRVEAEIEPDVRGWLRGFYAALSGEAGGDGRVFEIPPGGRMRDAFPLFQPSWLTDEALDHFAGELERGGLVGPLACFRTPETDWEDLAPWTDAPVLQPALYIGARFDGPSLWLADAVKAFPDTLPRATTYMIEDCGHWMQQERPGEVNAVLVEWLRGLPG
ncbi:alpha/beta fold hydrolase [Streptomyces sp. NPDC058301]|uniref:alpha/beta fold hydrolase n=1 Tax=Streptomyces sp. NPDC058301 TaxID=3346436 RepID=UPI0036E11E04